MTKAWILMASLLSVALAGCAVTPGAASGTLVQNAGQTLTLQGCQADLVSVWDRNVTLKVDNHFVTADDNYLTVDGRFIPRPNYKTIRIQCANGQFDVFVDGKPFKDLLAKGH